MKTKSVRILLLLAAVGIDAQTIVPDGSIPAFPSSLAAYPAYRQSLTANQYTEVWKPFKWEDEEFQDRLRWIYEVARSKGASLSGYRIEPRFNQAMQPVIASIVWGQASGASDMDVALVRYNTSVAAAILIGLAGVPLTSPLIYPGFNVRTATNVPVCAPWPDHPLARGGSIDIRRPCPDDGYPVGAIYPMVLQPGASPNYFRKLKRYIPSSDGGGFTYNPNAKGTESTYWLNEGPGIPNEMLKSAPMASETTPVTRSGSGIEAGPLFGEGGAPAAKERTPLRRGAFRSRGAIAEVWDGKTWRRIQ